MRAFCIVIVELNKYVENENSFENFPDFLDLPIRRLALYRLFYYKGKFGKTC